MTDLAGLARLFEINFAPSYHFQQPNPLNVRTGTEVNPIAQAPGVRMSFLSGLGGYLGQVLGTVPSILGGLQTAGVIGGGAPRAIAPAVGGVGAISKVAQTGAPSTAPMTAPTAIMRKVTTTAAAHPILTAAGGAAATAGAVATLVRSRKGVHPAVAAAMGMHRRRRMHVTNVKALRRSIRRLHGFEKVCRKVLRFTSPHRSHGRATFKKPKRRG